MIRFTSPRFSLTRAFSIASRCHSKETTRPINATHPAHHNARSSLSFRMSTSEVPDWPAPHQARAFSSRHHSRLHAPCPSHRRANLEPTYLAADTCRMARKPEPLSLSSCDVFKIASKAIWLATIEATDERDAIERVAQERNIPANRLIATQRR